MKIVINRCHGGFGLSTKAVTEYNQLTGKNLTEYGDFPTEDGKYVGEVVKRDDPTLITVIEALGKEANSRFSDLAIVEIPDDVAWHIEEYDGLEWVAENHRTWP